MEVVPLYQIKVNCIQCESSFQTSRIRSSFKKGGRRESDFYVEYKENNPNFYVVRVCPFCGFASTENFSEGITQSAKEQFYEKITSQWNQHDYGGERTWDEALQTFKLALVCAQIKQETDRIIAGILHHITWLYREKNNEEQEKRFLQFALESYIKVYEYEGIDLNNARLMYIIGDLHRRLGNYNDAVQWFSRVVNDKKIMDAAMIRACREQWAVVREEMQEQKEKEQEA